MEHQFRTILQPRLIRFDDAKESLIAAFNERSSGLKHRLALALTALEAGNPQHMMERGFSIVTNQRTGKIIRTYKDAEQGDHLTIRPAEGIIQAVAETISQSRLE
jgi:exodeoxyribonuclease VII large subunit